MKCKLLNCSRLNSLLKFNFKLCKGVSAISKHIICKGLKRIHCFTNSLPILPAAPVIKIVLLFNVCRISDSSTLISSRCRISSIFIFLICLKDSSPLIHLLTGGTTRTLVLYFKHSSVRDAFFVGEIF